jgi:DNA-binding transcriptional ArsR family regulator
MSRRPLSMSMFATSADYERALLDQEALAVLHALRELVAGLDATNWSSWQTTAEFSVQHEAAKLVLERLEGVRT